MRLYGLFRKMDGRWVREYPNLAYSKATAVRVFQSALLAGSLSGTPMSLRPVKADRPALTGGN